MGFYAPSDGYITVDQCDLIDEAKEVSQKFGVVFQDPSIFNGTILDNIRYGQWGASREECEAAVFYPSQTRMNDNGDFFSFFFSVGPEGKVRFCVGKIGR